MRPFLVRPVRRVKGSIALAGDKSISHRYCFLGAISRGKTVIDNFPSNKDCLFSVNAFKELGIRITKEANNASSALKIVINGKGLCGLKKPRSPIFIGDSGTTLRLLLGVLAGQDFSVRLTAGSSLSKRPMLRVTAPLRMMGAIINARLRFGLEEYPPITIKGGNLKGITYKMPVASAQVKSAILLAGLYARGRTCVIEKISTRDHSERVLKMFGAHIRLQKNKILVKGNKELSSPGRLYVPGDISSAGFFIVLASILPNAQLLIRNVSLNPTRIGIINVLKRMGADIKIQQMVHSKTEPMGDLLVTSSKLKRAVVRHKEVPSMIDELPILMVAASCAQGKTVFEGVGELRVKEADRINSMSTNLRKMGVVIRAVKDNQSENVIVHGTKELKGAKVKSYGDHRTAMSMVVAGLRAKGNTLIDDISCIDKSFPDFLKILRIITQ